MPARTVLVSIGLLVASATAAAGPIPTFGGAISQGDPGRVTALASADLNADGKVDLVAMSPSRRLVVPLISNGDGSFIRGKSVAFTSDVRSLAVGRLDGDRHVDVLAVGAQTTVLLGDGKGGLRVVNPIPLAGQTVATGDLTGDGKPDMVVGDVGSPQQDVVVAIGNGDGSFAAQISLDIGIAAATVAVIDMNADNTLDVVAANAAGQLAMRISRGDGTFDPPRVLAGPPVNVPSYQPLTGQASIAVNDLDRDGRLDVAVSRSGGDIVVFAGRGGGQFATPARYRAGGQSDGLAAADVNGDNLVDLITANPQTNRVSILLGTGAALFSSTPVSFDAGIQPTGLVVTDLNNDARADIAVGSAKGFVATLLSGATRPVLFGLRATRREIRVPATPCKPSAKRVCKPLILVQFGLSAPADVTLGFRSRGKFVGSARFSGSPGDNEFGFGGHTGQRRLPKGTYDIVGTAKNARGTSRPMRLSLIVR